MKKLFITSLFALGVCAANAQMNLNSGLTHHFKFDDNQDKFNAVTGSEELIYRTSVIPFSAKDRFGNLNGARRFPPEVSGYQLDNPNVPTGNAARSVSIWVKMADTTNNQGAIFSWGPIFSFPPIPSSLINRFYSLTHEQNRRLNNWAYANDLLSPTAIADTNWIHIAVTFDGDTSRMYLNGNLITKAAKSYNTAAQRLFIGFAPVGAANAGISVDDMRIYNRAITAEEVTSLYNAPQAAAYMHFKFDGNLKEEFSGLDANFIGTTPTYVADQNGTPNRAIRFNGSSEAVLFNQPALTNPKSNNVSFTAWVKKETLSQNAYVFGVRNSGTPNFNQFALYSANLLLGNNSGSTTTGNGLTAFAVQPCILSTQVTNGTLWTHIAVVKKTAIIMNPPVVQRRDSMFVYRNGILVSTTSATCAMNDSIVTNAAFSVGALAASSNNNFAYSSYFNGAVADVKYFRSALTPAQVAAEYNGSLIVTDLPARKVAQNALTTAQIFPNPTNGQFTVKGIASNSTITVLDMQGRVITQQVANQDETNINLNNSPAGIYLVRIVSNNNQSQTIKLVKE